MNAVNNKGAKALEKLQACILYACSKEQPSHAQLDHIKLNKVLWYSDTAAFMETGKSITGGRYLRKPHGPVARFMAPAALELKNANLLAFGKRFDPDRGIWLDTYEVIGDENSLDEDSELSLPELTAKEKHYLDKAFEGACLSADTSTISERTHGEVWELAVNGEEIPLYAMYAESVGRITKEHVDAAFGV